MEQYRKFIIDGMPVDFEIQQIKDSFDGSIVLFTNQVCPDSQKNATIVFDSYEAYRVVNESYRLKINSKKEKGSEGFQIYIVLDSSWIQWLKEESCGSVDMSDIKHFLFADSEFITEIVTYDDPKIGEWQGLQDGQ